MKSFLFISFCSFILMLLLSPLRGFVNFQTSSLVGFIVYFLFVLFCCRRYKKITGFQILCAAILGYWILQLPLRVRSFEGTLVSLPDALIQTGGIICGYLFWRLKKPFNILTALLGFLITFFMFFQGYDLWLHKLNYGTFTGNVLYTLPAKFEAVDEKNNLIVEKDFQGKIVLLDFWTTSCGGCFLKFPKVQEFYDKYKNNSSVIVLAVNAPIEEDKPGKAFALIHEEKYTFPVVVAQDAKMAENWGVGGYPTTFVIDRNGTMVFKGSIEKAVAVIETMK